jgi:AraC-like DNA-binding protein
VYYGDEFYLEITPDFDPGPVSEEELDHLFRNATRITQFHSSPNGSFIQNLTKPSMGKSLCYRIDEDCLIEINDSLLRTPVVIRNQVADVISFQFVSTVKRSEYLGKSKNIHNLGPAIIVSAVLNEETTYRMPNVGETIRTVIVYTTLSNLLTRMGESRDSYPDWLQEILEAKFDKPRQRVLFLEDIHRDLTWACFNLPVSGQLLKHWLAAKYTELICVGLQVLKNNLAFVKNQPAPLLFQQSEKIRRARMILNGEYAHPPSLSALAKHLGISETQLKSGFKSMNGTTVRQYCINRRIEAAKLLLKENRHSISEIGDIVGYHDHSAFSRAFRQLSGCSPQSWRQTGGS